MNLADMDPHDIKAEIRKRFGTLAAFERAFKLPAKSVTDVCRSRASSRVEHAIKMVIARPVSEFSEQATPTVGVAA
jgi:lambda repressor-like predicted transcriptional regulator